MHRPNMRQTSENVQQLNKQYQALSGLVELAKGCNAHPVLLMTWGYLEGHKQGHSTSFPSYHAMQVLCYDELHKPQR